MPITRLGLNGFGVGRAGDFSRVTTPPTHPVGVITRLGLNGYASPRRGSFANKGAAIAASGVRRLYVSRDVSDQCAEIDWNLPFGLTPLDKQEKKLARKARQEGLAIKSGGHELVLIDASEESEPVLVVKKHIKQGKIPLSQVPEIVEEQEIIMLLLIE